MKRFINVIGGGLAGSEAAYQIAKRGVRVKLYEMRPIVKTPAHHSNNLAELVCSNSFKSKSVENASGLLKEEMTILDSLIIQCARETSVPAGQSLSVDREKFSGLVNEKIKSNPLIEIIREEVVIIPKGITIIATGPLTSDKLTKTLASLIGKESLYFFDAAAPLIEASSIDMNKAYKKSRYDKGGADYINCPFNKDEFLNFYEELINAKRFPIRDFEKEIYFQGCQPIEVIAKKNYKSLTFGPMKPVGLEDQDGKRPYAVLQLRQDDEAASVYNMVGFQTNLLQPEQKRIFRMIPGLENANFLRYGQMHRNTYIDSPSHLLPTLQLKNNKNIFIAGQLSGVEGYMESTASGILAAINAVRIINQQEPLFLPLKTQLGSLINYITSCNLKSFQPMNANYGIMNDRSRDKLETARESFEALNKWLKENE